MSHFSRIRRETIPNTDFNITTGNTVDRFIFREYHGVKPYPKSLIIPKNIDYDKIDFHVILAFAHETYNKDEKGTGNFYADWDLDICGIKSVKEIKEKYPKVKVVLSIGGRDIQSVPDIIKRNNRTTKYPFSPIEKESWCAHAVDSLKKIIQQYKFDGIDINYQHINTHQDQDFSDYIGELITRLKDPKDKVIDEVSIAPSQETDEYYKLLYKEHSDDINWVNYQFNMDFLNLFISLPRVYPFEKLLAGASTDPRDGGNVPPNVFVKTCTDLIKDKEISGIFIWNANDYEKIALHIISTIPQ